MSKYTLKLQLTAPGVSVIEKSSGSKSTLLLLELNNKVPSKRTYQFTYPEGNCTYECCILSMDIHKKVYEPGHVRLKIQFLNKSANKVSLPASVFKGGVLHVLKENFPIVVCYYLFHLKQAYSNSNNGSFNIYIDAYSPDKFLMLEQYSRAYTGCKFYEDLLKTTSPMCLLHSKLKEAVGDAHTPVGLCMNFNSLRYTKKGGTNEFEYIHPYLVQYNESPYDFIVRTMNRCGEFFYYESGYLNFGWTSPDLLSNKTNKGCEVLESSTYASNMKGCSIMEINKFADVEMETSLVDDGDVTFMHDNYIGNYMKEENKKAAAFSPPAPSPTTKPDQTKEILKKFDLEVANDENLSVIPAKKDYSTWCDYALFPGPFWISLVMDTLSEESLVDMLVSFPKNVIYKSSAAGISSKSANNAYEKKFIKEILESDGKKLRPTDKTDTDSRYRAERLTNSNDRIWLFSSCSENVKDFDGEKPVFGYLFYGNNLQKMQLVEKNRIHLTFGSDNPAVVLLGGLITFNGLVYVVVDITEDCVLANCTIQALPTEVQVANNKITALGDVWPPLVDTSKHTRKSSPQHATVVDISDPFQLNRVRIRYSWQDSTDAPSPWIRVAVPMASDGSGFNFLPKIGDEAIINYENGNIERPYVEGMVYNEKHKGANTLKKGLARSITSINGHSIIFNDPATGANVLQGFSPLWGTVRKFFPSASASLSKTARALAGGIELTDDNGFYSISMSSDKRTITIDSPLGKIGLNAFTGITISAPNGNIKIEGKNVDIVARNNLTLTSGKNIAPFVEDGFKESLKSYGKNVASASIKDLNLIDMTFVRTVIESFLRPVGGRLLIKSNRCLCFESGKGKAEASVSVDLFTEMQKVVKLFQLYYTRSLNMYEMFKAKCRKANHIYRNIQSDDLKKQVKMSELFRGHIQIDINNIIVSKQIRSLNDLGINKLLQRLIHITDMNEDSLLVQCIKDCNFLSECPSGTSNVVSRFLRNNPFTYCFEFKSQYVTLGNDNCSVNFDIIDEQGIDVTKFRRYLFELFQTVKGYFYLDVDDPSWQGAGDWDGLLSDTSGHKDITSFLYKNFGFNNFRHDIRDTKLFRFHRTESRIVFSSDKNKIYAITGDGIELLNTSPTQMFKDLLNSINQQTFRR